MKKRRKIQDCSQPHHISHFQFYFHFVFFCLGGRKKKKKESLSLPHHARSPNQCVFRPRVCPQTLQGNTLFVTPDCWHSTHSLTHSCQVFSHISVRLHYFFSLFFTHLLYFFFFFGGGEGVDVLVAHIFLKGQHFYSHLRNYRLSCIFFPSHSSLHFTISFVYSFTHTLTTSYLISHTCVLSCLLSFFHSLT